MSWFLGLLTVLALITHLGNRQTQMQFPPLGDFLEVDGVRMHYREAGSGPALVLIHGSSANLRDFSTSLFTPLSQNYRVIAIDRPGHGYSERPKGAWPDPGRQAELIHQLLQQLKVERPVLVGHSWGGSVVLAYMLAYPDETAAGVLLAGATHPWTGGVAWYNSLAGVPLLGPVFAHTLVYPLGSFLLHDAVAGVFAPNPVPKEYYASAGVGLFLRPQTFLANAQDARGLSDFLVTQSLHYDEISQPLLLLTGHDDILVPAWNHSERLARQAPNAEQIEFEATGHALHNAHSARVAAVIEAFLARHKSGSGRGQSSVDEQNALTRVMQSPD
ncbi:alpha/beta fold hydrolase [Marinobacterium rhizophilum]|uniref:alpha/beta fold hydrolase n=1 Tax=Marinobacterium rhizophilum TaxID=420402 RepID=UPI000364D553|nr:alpha/beta hydrolase [Marinobacterium rhizophilum]